MNLLGRRSFVRRTGRLLLAGTAAAFLPLTGCDWVKFLRDYIPVINSGISTIESFFGIALPIGVSATLDGVKAVLLDIETACTDYENAPAASKATLLGKIETFLKGVVDGFQNVLDHFGTLGPVPAIILGVINIVISTLSWLVGKFSNAANVKLLTLSRVQLTVRVGNGLQANQIIVIRPVQRTQDQFRSEINTLMAANGRSDIII